MKESPQMPVLAEAEEAARVHGSAASEASSLIRGTERGATRAALLGGEIAWSKVIPAEDWRVYKDAIKGAREAAVGCLLGGGFGLAAYTGRWRNTKDMDLYILPKDRERMVHVLTKAGFGDYYDTLPYDRG